MSNTIAEYFTSLKLKPDFASIKQVDKFFNTLENLIDKRSKIISSKISAIGIFNTSGNLPLKKKQINDLADAHIKAYKKVETASRQHAARINRIEKSVKYFDPNTTTGKLNSPLRKNPVQSFNEVVRPTNRSFRPTTGVMGVGGAFSAIAGMSLFGFTLGKLNKTMQELEMMPVAMESVTGSAEKASEQLDFLGKLGKQVGATRREMVPEYTKMLASAMGTPLEKQLPQIFSSITKYGKVMGLDQEAMKGTFKSITQMINKQQIMAEELKGQTAERLPAAVKLMAEAMTGGDTAKLIEMMAAGKLNPNTALPKFAMQLEAKAAGGWSKYTKTTRFQENMTRVGFEDQLINFGKQGGNLAFFRIWKTFADSLPKMNGLIKGLAGSFNLVASAVSSIADIVVTVSKGFDWFYTLSPKIQEFSSTAIAALAGVGLAARLMGLQLKTAFLPLTAAWYILTDIAGYFSGNKKSYLGYLLGDEDKEIYKPTSLSDKVRGMTLTSFTNNSPLFNPNTSSGKIGNYLQKMNKFTNPAMMMATGISGIFDSQNASQKAMGTVTSDINWNPGQTFNLNLNVQANGTDATAIADAIVATDIRSWNVVDAAKKIRE